MNAGIGENGGSSDFWMDPGIGENKRGLVNFCHGVGSVLCTGSMG